MNLSFSFLSSYFLVRLFTRLCFLVFAAYLPAIYANPAVESSCDLSLGANIIGLSLDHKTQEPLYCEYHFDEYQAQGLQRSVVKYIDTQGQAIAEKRLDFSQKLLAPNVSQQDQRQGEKRMLAYNADQQHFTLMYQKNNDAKPKQAIITEAKLSAPIVADAGFDVFVKQQWQPLVTGDAVELAFLSPVHTRAITLTITERAGEVCGGIDYDSSQSICLMVKPKSAMLKLFAKPLALLYDRSTQRLQVFSGVVNLIDAKGKSKVADIHYWYRS